MIYLTQLIYVKPGEEEIFDEFESVAIPLIARYHGRLLLRVRPKQEAYIEAGMEKPYEIHFVEFGNEEDFRNFSKDEERKKFLHLKEKSVTASWLVKGERL